jgi:hypothetical protein
MHDPADGTDSFGDQPARSWQPVSLSGRRQPAEPLVIDCDDCSLRDSAACGDCLVTFICAREPGEAVVVDVAEERALRLLADSGLVPPVRHRRRAV